MRVTIVDLDWYNKFSFLPNPKCMKISSYYKQLQGLVNFATTEYELKMDYDLMYVIREDYSRGRVPSEINLLDENVFLIGQGMQFYDRYLEDIDSAMAACRPDYQLYPLRDENKYAKADVVQFFHNGKLLPLIQDYHNAYTKAKFTYVLDEDFWEHREKDLEKCVEKLTKDKHIIFSGGIDLSTIFSSKIKTKLLQKLKVQWDKTEVKWKLGNSEEFFDFLQKARGVKNFKINVPIEYSGDHLKNDSYIFKDFYRYCNFAVECKKRKIHIYFQAPERKLSNRWFFFEALESWTKYNFTESLVNHMTKVACRNRNMSSLQILITPLYWDDSVYILMHWFKDYYEFMPSVAFRCWGERTEDVIDIRKLAENFLVKKGEEV